MYENNTLLNTAEVTIIGVFLDLRRHYFAELVKVTKLSKPRTLRVLRKFVKQKILEVKTEANVKYYSLQKSSSVFSLLSLVEYNKTLAFLKKQKNLKRALEMFKEKYHDYITLVVFGSLVKGYAHKSSDVDLLLTKESFSEHDIKKVEDIIEIVNGRTGLKISPYFMKIKEFRNKNELAKEIIAEHIIIEGGETFFRCILQ
ncbi:nucleotidyltransferase domain-containing protein [Candidatus Woesearchaeota archaeon]|nr:nucleotidyltransferase domain-containing protein [Candidatus Woesearchaeota archaeon]